MINLLTVPLSGLWSAIAGIINTNFGTISSDSADNIVTINDDSEYEAKVPNDASFYYGEADTKYSFGGAVSPTKTFVGAEGTTIEGVGPFSALYNYVGTGDAFASTGKQWSIKNIAGSCANGRLFNIDGGILVLDFANWLNIKDSGSFNNAAILSESGSLRAVTGLGFVFSGAIEILSISKMRHYATAGNTTFIGINLGTSTSSILELDDYEPDGPVGSVGVSGVATDPDVTVSGNISEGEIGTINGSKLGFSGMVPFGGTLNPPNDIRWTTRDNGAGVKNSKNQFDFYLTGTGPHIVDILFQNVWTAFGAPNGGTSFVVKQDDRFSIDVLTGIGKYLGEREIEVRFVMPVSFTKSGGGSSEVDWGIAKNWIAGDPPEPDSIGSSVTSTIDGTMSVAVITLNKNDTFEPITINVGGPQDVLVSRLTMIGVGE